MRRLTTVQTPATAIALLLAIAALPLSGTAKSLEPGMIFPVSGDSVRLILARISIGAPHDEAPGREIASYRLRNLGSRPVDLAVAFTGGVQRPDSLRLRIGRSVVPYRMEATARIARRARVPSTMPDSLPVWRLTIPPFEIVEVEVTGQVAWSIGSGDDDEVSRELSLHSWPARLWSGPIDDFAITFVFDELTAALLHCPEETRTDQASCVRTSITPAGFEWFARGPGWRFRKGDIPEEFRVRFAWREQEEND